MNKIMKGVMVGSIIAYYAMVVVSAVRASREIGEEVRQLHKSFEDMAVGEEI